MFEFIKKQFRSTPTAAARPRTTRLNAEALETREVLSPTLPVPNFYTAGGLAYPGSAATVAVQNQANQQINVLIRNQMAQIANLYNSTQLQRAGLDRGLADALSNAARLAAQSPSLLDPRVVSQADFNQAVARLRAGATDLGYVLHAGGYRRDLLIVGGYKHLANMTPNQLASLGLRDPLVSLISSNLVVQTTQWYLQRYFNVTGGFNGVGILGSVGLANTGVGAVVGQAQAIGASGLTRPPGTGTGSPFINMLIGLQPTTSFYQWNGNPYEWGANNPYAYRPIG
jgi:hypothetical protein